MTGPLTDRPSGHDAALTVGELIAALSRVPGNAPVHLCVDFPLPPLAADDTPDVDLLAPVLDVTHRTDGNGHYVEFTVGFPG